MKAALRKEESGLNENTKNESVGHAQSMNTFVDQLKFEGLSNTAIITQILSESESGELAVPSEKLEEYENYLALLNSSDIPQSDKTELTKILNRPGFDITADDSFEQFGKEVLKSRTISESTKQILIKKFKVKPIVTGSDLKKELVARSKFIAQRKSEISELTDSLKTVNKDLDIYKADLNGIKEQLKNPNLTDSERKELEQETAEIADAIKLLEEQAQEMKDSKRILKASTPNNSIALGNATASYEDEMIRVQLPDNRNYLNLPIEMSPEDITRSVNAFLVYEELEKRGLTGIVFPDERLQEGVDLPSNSMMVFVNEILSTIGMSKNNEILTLENLKEFNQYLDCFSSNEAKGNVELERKEFQELVCDENGIFLGTQFTETLQHLKQKQNSSEFHYYPPSKSIAS
ncbi:MAG: hypothetical protein JKX84_01325 [Flavobacteriales bacterium]|nr:hypothetical protein [Flavobacteriales bacterium]